MIARLLTTGCPHAKIPPWYAFRSILAHSGPGAQTGAPNPVLPRLTPTPNFVR